MHFASGKGVIPFFEKMMDTIAQLFMASLWP